MALTAAHSLALQAANNDDVRTPLTQRPLGVLVTSLQHRRFDDASVSGPKEVYKAAQQTWSIPVSRTRATPLVAPSSLSPRERSTLNATAEARATNDAARAGSQALLSAQQALTQSKEISV